MLYVTTYGFRGEMSPETTKELLSVHAERGSSPGELAHYLRFDGSGGVIVSDVTPDMAERQYENVLHFQQWLTMETTPVMTVEEAMPSILKVHG